MKPIGRIRVSEVMQSVTLTVELRGMRSFRLRLWIATRLICLAGRILQVGRIELKGPAE